MFQDAIVIDDERTGLELFVDDAATMTSALTDVYVALIALRPTPADVKYTVWQRAMRASEDALRIHPVERYTKGD